MDFASLGSSSGPRGYGPNARQYVMGSPNTPLENIVVIVNESQIVKAMLPYNTARAASIRNQLDEGARPHAGGPQHPVVPP